MDILEQGLRDSLNAHETGEKMYLGGDGNLYTQSQIDEENMTLFQGAEDQPSLPASMTRRERRGQEPTITPEEGLQLFSKTMSGALTGLLPGAVAGSVGAPGDIVGLFAGAYEAATAEEGERINSFLQTLTSISAQYGSERALEFGRNIVEDLPVSEPVKEGMRGGLEAGSFVGIGGAVTKGGTALARGAQRIGQKILEPGKAPAMAPQVPSAATADIEAGRPVVAFEETAKDFQKQLESSEIDINALEEHPHVQNTLDDMMSRPTTQQEAGDSWGTPEWEDSRSFTTPQGEQIVGWKPAVKWLHNHARSFAWTDDNLPVPENPVKFDKELIIVMGPPAAGKSTLANPIARSKNASIIDADEAKKLIPGYDDGVGANVVHEESSQINHIVFESAIQTGENIVLPIVGGNANKVISKYIGPAKQQGYRVTLVDMMVDPDEALNRMYGRFVSKSRLIPPDVAKVGRAPSEAFDQLVEKGAADAYTKIDNNPGRGEPRLIVRDDDNLIESSGIDARRLDQEGGRSNRGSDSTQVQTNGPRGRGGNDADITVTYQNEAAQ